MPLILENAPTVTFREVGGLFIASFVRPTALETPDPVAEKPPKNPLKNPLKSKLKSETAQNALLQQLRQHPEITVSGLMRATGLSRDSVKYHLSRLKRSGTLRRHGPKNGGWWEVIKGRKS